MKLTINEACAILYKGQANVAKTAKEVGISTEEMKRTFAVYAKQIPLTDDEWQKDVEICWPYAS